MLEKIKHKILRISKAAGVEATLRSDGKMDFHLLILSRTKDLIIVEAKEGPVEDIEKLTSLIPSGTPVALTINGRGVLHKKATDQAAVTDADLISQILPNAKEADFYIQKAYSGKNLFLSVIRKESFNKVLQLFEANHLPVVFASCGPFIAADVLPFINNVQDEISFSGFRLPVRNNSITDFKTDVENEKTVYELGEDKISASLLTAYAGAFHLFLEESLNKGLEAEKVSTLAEEFRNKNVFRLAGYSVLGFFVGLMLLNYLLYNYYQSANNELTGKSTAYSGMAKEIEKLEKQVKEKEYFLRRAGWLSPPRTSYFADQIASTIPSSIRLTSMKVNPKNEKLSKKERKQIFQADTIYVAGTCSNPTVLNPWMKELKNRQWVKNANTVDYTHDAKTRSGTFEVEIAVSDEF